MDERLRQTSWPTWDPGSLCSYHSILTFPDLMDAPRWPEGLLTLIGRIFPRRMNNSQAFSGELALVWTQFLLSHYFDSAFLQIEDSGARGLGNFPASCNALSLNWFYQDNYLKPLDRSRRQAREVRWHIFICRQVLGFFHLFWLCRHRKGRQGKWEIAAELKSGPPCCANLLCGNIAPWGLARAQLVE